jgi:hypothetical protein
MPGVFRALGGHVTQVFVGITAGYAHPELTAQDVCGQLAVIPGLSAFAVPGTALHGPARPSTEEEACGTRTTRSCGCGARAMY